VFLQEFDHENIIKLINVIKADNEKDIYLVFEFMDIDLHHVIRENILKDKHKEYIVYQIARAIKYLHSADLLHRDLKPSNILINSDCLVKVCDFGLVRSVARSDGDSPAIMTEYVATRWYRAPEILLGSHHYTKGVDIWSFGCLMAELIKGKPLFAGNSTLNQLEKLLSWTGSPSPSDIQSLESDVGWSMIENMRAVKQKSIREWLPNADELALDLISKMLQFSPKKRITIEEVLKHPYLRDFHNSSN
jgi:mitogen-activated protein kinase 15